MECQRCKGLMVMDHVVDIADDTGHLWLRAWRCLTCGDVLDPQILRRRLTKAAGQAPVLELFPKEEVGTEEEPSPQSATARRNKKSAEPGRMSA